VPNIAGAEFEAFFKKEMVLWAKMVKDAGIAPQ
jgi:hypothetical protein